MSSDAVKNLVWAHIGMVFGALLILLATSIRSRDGIWIPCDLAVISPDIPVAAKEECRRRGK